MAALKADWVKTPLGLKDRPFNPLGVNPLGFPRCTGTVRAILAASSGISQNDKIMANWSFVAISEELMNLANEYLNLQIKFNSLVRLKTGGV